MEMSTNDFKCDGHEMQRSSDTYWNIRGVIKKYAIRFCNTGYTSNDIFFGFFYEMSYTDASPPHSTGRHKSFNILF